MPQEEEVIGRDRCIIFPCLKMIDHRLVLTEPRFQRKWADEKTIKNGKKT